MITQKEFDDWIEKDPVEIARRLYHDAKAVGQENVRLRKRCDPQLIESALVANLNLPCSTENAEALQVGAMLTLVDLFDRKMDRAMFIDVAEQVTALYGLLGRLSIADAILHLVEKNTFTKEKIATAAKELAAYGENNRKQILTTLKLVASCPTSEDPIN